MIVKEVNAKTILSKSKVFQYTVNPYFGCEHGCTYCYARFMKRYTSCKEPWGEFVDVKINAPVLLQREIKKKRRGRVWISGVCDAYQPLEKKFELTKRCLEIFLKHNWSVTIQTKSPLVLRDMILLRQLDDVEVGITITSADDNIRKIFEPNAPTIQQRIEALHALHSNGIKTFAMVAPILPKASELIPLLKGKIDRALVDRMNYHYADWLYKKYDLEYAMTDSFFAKKKTEFLKAFEIEDVPCEILY